MTSWIISSSALILAMMILRRALKGKVNPRLQYLLWALVLVRLLCPVSFFTSSFSIQNIHQQVMEQPAGQQMQQAITAPLGNVVTGGVNPGDWQGTLVPNPTTGNAAQNPGTVPQNPGTMNENPGITGDTADTPSQDSVQPPDSGDASREPQQTTDAAPLTLGAVLALVWAAGMGAMTVGLVGCNLHFAARLKRSRKKLDIPQSPIDVYVTRAIDTPCLFGLFHPAVYLTPAAAEDPRTRRYVLTHELTHYLQFDHVWSVLRAACLVLHWYNPLVWAAFRASRLDCEMSCDEGTLKTLGEEHRGDYGRILIGLATQTRLRTTLVTATGVADGKKAIRERIIILMKKPKTALITLVSVILVCSLIVGCTFTGAPAKENEQDRPETLGELIGEGSHETFLVEEEESNTTFTSIDTRCFDFAESEYLLDWDNARTDGGDLYADSELHVQVMCGNGYLSIEYHNGSDAEWIYIGPPYDCYVPLKLNPDAQTDDSIENIMNATLEQEYDDCLFNGYYEKTFGTGVPETVVEAYRVAQIRAKKRAAQEGLTGRYVYGNVGTQDTAWEMSEDGKHVYVRFKIVFFPLQGEPLQFPGMEEGINYIDHEAYLTLREDGCWYRETDPTWMDDEIQEPEESVTYSTYFEQYLPYDGVNNLVTTGMSWDGNSILVGDSEMIVVDAQGNKLNTIPNPDSAINWVVCDGNWIYGIRDEMVLVRTNRLDGSMQVLFNDGVRTIGENVFLADGCVLFFTANTAGTCVVYRLFVPDLTLDILATAEAENLTITQVLSNHEVVWSEKNPYFETLMDSLMEDLPEKYKPNGQVVDDLESWVSQDYRVPMSYCHYLNTYTGEKAGLPYFGNYYSVRTRENYNLGDDWWNDYRATAENPGTPLTPEQIEQVNEAFQTWGQWEDGASYRRTVSCFFDQYYSNPWELDLDFFLKYFTDDGLVAATEEERQALKAHWETLWSGQVWRHSYDAVDTALLRYLNVSLEELLGNGGTCYPYLEEYDSFYTVTSDVGGSDFLCISGTIHDGFVKLYDRNNVLTLVERDGRYHFYSYMSNSAHFTQGSKYPWERVEQETVPEEYKDLFRWNGLEDSWYLMATMSIFDDPTQIDLFTFLYNGFDGMEGWKDFTEAEQEAVLNQLEAVYTNVDKLPAGQMEELLIRIFGVSLDQVQIPERFAYYSETDCYYHQHGDALIPEITLLRVVDGGDGTVQIYYCHGRSSPATHAGEYPLGDYYYGAYMVMTLKQVDGHWQVLSNVFVN